MFELPEPEKVKIEVFNLLGQRLKTLINKSMPAGSYEVEFTAKDLLSGVYLYRIESNEFQDMKKMILATKGKVFTFKTLDHLIENTRLKEYRTK